MVEIIFCAECVGNGVILMINKMAKEIFLEYRKQLRDKMEQYNRLRTAFPLNGFPFHAKQIWRLAVLAETWGNVATNLCGGKIDFLKNWREGK